MGGVVAFLLFVMFISLIIKQSIVSLFYKKNFLALSLVLCATFILLKSGGGLNLKYVWVILALASASATGYSDEKNNLPS